MEFPSVNPAGVRVLKVKPHYMLHAGCGCVYPVPGPWLDGKPNGVIRSGTEPGKVCRKHKSDSCNGLDVTFP